MIKLKIDYYNFREAKDELFEINFDPRTFKEFEYDTDLAFETFEYLVKREITLMDKYRKYQGRYTRIRLYFDRNKIKEWKNENERYRQYKEYYKGYTWQI